MHENQAWSGKSRPPTPDAAAGLVCSELPSGEFGANVIVLQSCPHNGPLRALQKSPVFATRACK